MQDDDRSRLRGINDVAHNLLYRGRGIWIPVQIPHYDWAILLRQHRRQRKEAFPIWRAKMGGGCVAGGQYGGIGLCQFLSDAGRAYKDQSGVSVGMVSQFMPRINDASSAFGWRSESCPVTKKTSLSHDGLPKSPRRQRCICLLDHHQM